MDQKHGEDRLIVTSLKKFFGFFLLVTHVQAEVF